MDTGKLYWAVCQQPSIYERFCWIFGVYIFSMVDFSFLTRKPPIRAYIYRGSMSGICHGCAVCLARIVEMSFNVKYIQTTNYSESIFATPPIFVWKQWISFFFSGRFCSNTFLRRSKTISNPAFDCRNMYIKLFLFSRIHMYSPLRCMPVIRTIGPSQLWYSPISRYFDEIDI